ncbi:unnamed protein product [Trichobilharzia szidati]|nr:unnamed protein product [Trichobilharzia szidati]
MTTDNNFLTIDVVSHGETFHLEGHPCSLSAFSHVPKSRNLPRERTYFNSPEKEKSKAVPSLSSSIYGHRLNKNIEISDRKHARIMLVESEFYRRNGIDL